jgi:E3 ubiquitin-protein ligase HUWE1
LVRSYAGCAKIISQHIYKASDFSHQINVNAAIEQQNQNSTCSITSASITEDTNALAFLLDNLLAANQTFGDKDCPSLCRLLIVALASCNHCLDSQNALVHEVKQALSRAINLPESNDKHIKIQAFASIINTMIETCPPIQNQVQQQQNGMRNQNQPLNTNNVNNMMKIMHKKGLINDLARVPLYMDLSCAKCIETLNTILKPLETMTKTLNISVRKRSDLMYSHKSHGIGAGLIPLTSGSSSSASHHGATRTILPAATSTNTTAPVASLNAAAPSSGTVETLNVSGSGGNVSRPTSQSTSTSLASASVGQATAGTSSRTSGSQRRSNNLPEEQSLRDIQQHSGVTSDVAGLNLASDNNLVLADAAGN